MSPGPPSASEETTARSPSEACEPRAGDRRSPAAGASTTRALSLLLGLLPSSERRRWWRLVPLVLLAALAEVAAAAAVLALLRALATGMTPGAAVVQAAGFTRGWGSLPPERLLALLAGLIGGKNLLLALVERRQARVASAAAAAVSTRLVDAYLHAPYVYLRREGSAAALHRVTLSVAEAFHLVIGPAIHLLGEVAVAAALLALLALASPLAALAAALPIAALIGAFLAATRGVVSRAGERYDATQARVTARLQEALRAHKEIRVLGRESALALELGALQGEIARARAHVGTLAGLPRLLNETIFALGALAVGVGLVRGAGSGAELLPLLGLWAYAGFRLLPTANRIAVNVLALRYGGAQAADLERAVAELEGLGRAAEAREASAGATEPPAGFRTELRTTALSFRWDGAAADALQGVDLTIRRGEMFGVAGPSGAGKSTFLDLLLALMPPTAGDVLADGRSVFAAPRAWRRRLGYVPQEALLLADTVRRNVACGRDDGEGDRGRLEAALRLARLEKVVATLPEGAETRVGDGGAGLSGGERQRVAIARALYGEPDLLLLDEPTSALDDATEAELVATLRALAGPVTVVVASHRPGVLAACDRVAVLDGGRLVGVGAPGTLPGSAGRPGRRAPAQRPDIDARDCEEAE